MFNIDKNLKRNNITLKDIVITIIIALSVLLVVKQFYITTTVKGQSMQSTLNNKEMLILDVNAYNKDKPKYKDIIVFERRDLSQRYFIKRVIGVEGDTLKIQNNKLFINNELIDEAYIKEDMVTEDLEVRIPKGKVFVMGDNRNNSIDSRSFVIGLVDVKDEIVGKAIFNLSKFKKVDGLN